MDTPQTLKSKARTAQIKEKMIHAASILRAQINKIDTVLDALKKADSSAEVKEQLADAREKSKLKVELSDNLRHNV